MTLQGVNRSTKTSRFMASLHLVMFQNQHRDLAVSSGFDTSFSNFFISVLSKKHIATATTPKKAPGTGHIFRFLFFWLGDGSSGFHPDWCKAKKTLIIIILMMEINLWDTLESGFLLQLRNRSFLSKYDSKHLVEFDRQLARTSQGPVDTEILCWCWLAAMVTAVLSFGKWGFRVLCVKTHSDQGTKSAFPVC